MTAVLVHGVPETPALWKPLIGNLERTDIVTPALPGFLTDRPAGLRRVDGRVRGVAHR